MMPSTAEGEAFDERHQKEKLRKNIFITTMAILVSNTKSIRRGCFRLESEETPLISQWQSAPVLPLATLVCPHPHPGCEAVLKHSGNKLTVAQMMKSPSISLIMQSNDHLQLSLIILNLNLKIILAYLVENFKLIIISVRNHNPAINIYIILTQLQLMSQAYQVPHFESFFCRYSNFQKLKSSQMTILDFGT